MRSALFEESWYRYRQVCKVLYFGAEICQPWKFCSLTSVNAGYCVISVVDKTLKLPVFGSRVGIDLVCVTEANEAQG